MSVQTIAGAAYLVSISGWGDRHAIGMTSARGGWRANCRRRVHKPLILDKIAAGGVFGRHSLIWLFIHFSVAMMLAYDL